MIIYGTYHTSTTHTLMATGYASVLMPVVMVVPKVHTSRCFVCDGRNF